MVTFNLFARNFAISSAIQNQIYEIGISFNSHEFFRFRRARQFNEGKEFVVDISFFVCPYNINSFKEDLIKLNDFKLS